MSDEDRHDLPFAGVADRALRVGEDVLYLFIAVLLIAGALVVLVEAAVSLVTGTLDDPHHAIEKTLDSLLVVFILVELLSAVRETLDKRQLVAEPFLLVGLIASIKEIVVIGAFSDPSADIEKAMLQIGVLGAVVLALSVALLLVRRKEREPEEAEVEAAREGARG